MAVQVDIGGIEVHAFRSMSEALDDIFDASGQVRPGCATAINPEKLMLARRDAEMRRVLNQATIRYADGAGVVALLRRSVAGARRVAGCELWEEVMREAGRRGISVFLVGAKPDVLNPTAERLKRDFGVPIVGAIDGFFAPTHTNDIVEKIAASGARIVSVAMGSPRQERFIEAAKVAMPSTFFMGVGGTYDVFTGRVARAPLWMRRSNLEWLFRLVQTPSRWRRQLRLIHFVWLAATRQL